MSVKNIIYLKKDYVQNPAKCNCENGKYLAMENGKYVWMIQ